MEKIALEDKEKLVDKVTGMLAGFALGDALGTPHEFFNNEYTGKLEYKVQSKRRYKEPLIGVVGQVSDDTEMTLTLLNQLLEDDGYNRNNVILSYIEWANSKCPFMGKNTRALFKGIKTIKGYEGRYKKIFDTKKSIREHQSNGSLMRCSPLFHFTDDIIEDDCSITNPSKFNIEAETLYCDALNSLLYNEDPINIIQDLLAKVKNENLKKRIDGSLNFEIVGKITDKEGEEIDVTENRGWIGHAFTFAMETLARPLTFTQVMDWTIKENIKGDTDTNAAISGAIVGMKYGFNKLLQAKVTAENWEILMSVDTEEGDIPRPEKYSPRRIPELAAEFVEVFLKE
jgi:ADP-ribosylglycohydrolase